MPVSDIYSNGVKVYCLISVLEYCTKIIAMAGLANRFSCKFLCRSLTHQPQIRWQTTAHTLNVRQRIQEKRDQALVGGGQKRIAAQHKKVMTQVICIQYYYTVVSHSLTTRSITPCSQHVQKFIPFYFGDPGLRFFKQGAKTELKARVCRCRAYSEFFMTLGTC